MCNLSQGIENIGIEKGSLQTIANMVTNLKLPLEEAIVAAGIPEQTRESYTIKVNELINQLSNKRNWNLPMSNFCQMILDYFIFKTPDYQMYWIIGSLYYVCTVVKKS